MNQSSADKRRPWWKRWVFESPTVIFTMVVVAAATILAGLHYRTHLLWHFQKTNAGLDSIQSFPDHPMPKTSVPPGWKACRVGCVEFLLPAELANSQSDPENATLLSRFHDGTKTAIVSSVEEAGKPDPLLLMAQELHPESVPFSMPRLQLEFYRARSGDFNWSMSPDEVNWHIFRLTHGKIARVVPHGHVETFFTQDVDAMVVFGSDHAALAWQFHEAPCEGWFHFENVDADRDWIRAVCQSLRLATRAEAEH